MRTFKIKVQNETTPLTHKEAAILYITSQLMEGNIPLTIKRIASSLPKPYSNEFIAATVKEITGQEIF